MTQECNREHCSSVGRQAVSVRRNKIAQCIEEGRKAVGIRQRTPSPDAVEVCAGEVDFVYLDCEHGYFELHDIRDICRSAELADVTVVARVPECDPGLISRFLNAGVQGIIVPHVSTADTARAVVEACHYPPEGQRPFATARASWRASGSGELAEYQAQANANMTISVQIEDTEAVANLAEIVAVPGITYFTIGKQDLTASMGFPRQHKGFPPQVQATIERIETAIHAAGAQLKDDVMRVGYVDDFILQGVRALRGASK